MKKLNLLHLCLIVLMFSVGAASAQYTITLPKINDIFKPKTKKPKTVTSEQSRNENQSNDSPAQDEIKANPNAPADYDANLQPGAMAIGISTGAPETVKIVSKSGGVYKAMSQESPNPYVVYYKANSIYPYFNELKFRSWADQYDIALCVGWYAAKHNISEDVLYANGSRFYTEQQTLDVLQYRLEKSLLGLAELENLLNKETGAFPETYAGYRYNPALIKAAAVGRSECSQWVLDKKNSRKFEESTWLMAHRDGIAKTLKAVNDYDPATMISMNSDSEYALYAVSPKARTKWLTDTKALDFKEPVDALLTPLAEALAKKLPNYPPPVKSYSLRSAGEEAMMKRALGNAARYKVFSGGLQPGGWKIETNSLGIPKSRYKYGMLYVRDTEADHPYCHAAFVNIVQSYAGGGTYAASRAVFAGESLVACPAGK